MTPADKSGKRESLVADDKTEVRAPEGFHLGSIARAPPLLQKLGLEWAWRIKENAIVLHDIDAILSRLEVAVARERKAMDKLVERLRQPAA